MQQEAKIITCQNLQGQTIHFVILNNQILGSGAFGIVKKGYDQSRQFQQLAVKIVPYGDQKSKQKINKQVQILKHLPDNPNLVKVLPLKCFSEKNFYIYMEYCNQGTLENLIKTKFKNKQYFTQEQIFQAFYQILNGYQALWKKKILHQDLKPDNILVKNKHYKITDFGFSIFHQGVKMNRERQGTFPYMPLQKLTVPNYYASTKSDVFALGVIFFKMITGRHPYVITQFQNYKQYIDQLRVSQLSIPNYIRAKMSIPMQHLFDLVLKMVAKKETDRIDFEEVYKFIQEEQMFLKFVQQKEQIHTQQVQVKEKNPIRVVDNSVAFAIPFSISRDQEEMYQRDMKNQHVQFQQKLQTQTIRKIDRYICSMRLMVYFFDRLNRKLNVQKMKKQKQNEKNDDAQIQEKAILALLYLSTKITTQTLEDSRYSRVFSQKQWTLYKKSDPQMLKLIKIDEQYLKCMTNDILMQTKQSKIADRHKIIQKSKKPLRIFMQQQVKHRLLDLLNTRISWISPNDRRLLTTLNYIVTAIQIIDNFQQKKQEWEELEIYFRKVEIEEINQLFEKVVKGLDKLDIQYSIDQGEW